MSSQPFTIGIDARMLGEEQTGIGKYIARLLERLPLLAPDMQFVAFLKEPGFSRFNSKYQNVEKRKVASHWYGYGEQLVLPWQILAAGADLVHFPHFNAPLLYPGKFIVTIHDLTPHFFPGPKAADGWRRAMFRLVFCGALTRARRIIAVSNFTKEDIVKNFGTAEENIEVVYEGVDGRFGRGEPREKSAEIIRDRYGIEKPFILYVGVWREHKNLVGLLEAYHVLRERHGVRHDLVLCGSENPLYPEARRAWEQLGIGGAVKRPGFIPSDDLAHFYRAAAATVVPSFYEGFGLTGLESLACGTPVAASRAASLPEVLGDAAIFFDPLDPAGIAEAIAELLKNAKLRAELVENGGRQLQRFSWDAMAEKTVELYRGILSASS